MIKYAVLYDPDLFRTLEANGLFFDRETVIARCVELKRNVVMEDEFDTGSRMLLNLGHTVGHGVEAKSHFRCSHGESVGIGMAIVSRAGAKLGLTHSGDCEKLLNLLQQFGLAVDTQYTAEELMTYMLSDKKRSGDVVKLIIPRAIGRCEIIPTPVSQLKQFIEAGLSYGSCNQIL